jgi:hypothetical protein
VDQLRTAPSTPKDAGYEAFLIVGKDRVRFRRVS